MLTALFVILAAQGVPPWEQDWSPSEPVVHAAKMAGVAAMKAVYDNDPNVAWAGIHENGDLYHILKSDLRRNDPVTGQVTFWMRGDHSANLKVEGGRSVWNVTLDCKGRHRFNASTLFAEDGTVVEETDTQGAWKLTRPDTVFYDVEKAICAHS